MNIKSEKSPEYITRQEQEVIEKENAIIAQAISILESRVKRSDCVIDRPDTIKALMRLRIGSREHEVFTVVYLTTRHSVIAINDEFRGTIDGASVHPREIVKEALRQNAAAVIFAHNHPSGNVEPSTSDVRITYRLKDALALVDVRVLDHLVVSESDVVSMAEQGSL
jgi:DNA repair protein RadC